MGKVRKLRGEQRGAMGDKNLHLQRRNYKKTLYKVEGRGSSAGRVS